MGREVRRVPKEWEHPKDGSEHYIPLLDGYGDRLREFKEAIVKKGLEEALEYFGGGPVKDDYMPEWPDEEKTHLMMYEDCTEGTPISPVFATPEKLARWLTDNRASAFGGMTATYEQWLATCNDGWVPSGVYSPETGLVSGVAAMAKPKKET